MVLKLTSDSYFYENVFVCRCRLNRKASGGKMNHEISTSFKATVT